MLPGQVSSTAVRDVVSLVDLAPTLLEMARKTNSGFLIINSLHEAGKKFESLGGVAAFLRYKL
jgi:stalled ribosome rescue protein Dom34